MTRHRLFTVLLLVLLIALSGTGAHLPSAFGAAKPTSTPKPSPTPKPSNTPKPSPTPKKTARPTSTSVPIQTPTMIPTDTPTSTPVPTDTPTNTSIPTDTPTDTPIPTPTMPVQDSLLAYWNFDDTSGSDFSGPTAADVSGNGDPLSFGNPGVTWTTDTPPLPGDAAAITLDGSTQDGQDQGGIDLSYRSFSVAMWAKRARTGQQEILFSQANDIGSKATNQVLELGFRPSNAFFCGFYNDDLDTSAMITDTNWHHYACTFDVSTGVRNAYVDGVLVGSDRATGPYVGSWYAFVGKYPSYIGGGDNFAGSIDDLRVYTVALSDATVAALAQGSPVPTPTPGGPTPTPMPTSTYCSVSADLQPPEGWKIPQLLTLDATGSTTTCNSPFTYEWACQSDSSPADCAAFVSDANDNGKYDNPTPVLNVEANAPYQIWLTVCAGGICAPTLRHIYEGAIV